MTKHILEIWEFEEEKKIKKNYKQNYTDHCHRQKEEEREKVIFERQMREK